MKPSDLAVALDILIQAKQPSFVWGPPGIGKSQIVRQVADAKYAASYGCSVDANGVAWGGVRGKVRRPLQTRPWLVDLRAVLLDPVDLRGLPHVNGDGRAAWAMPEFLPRKGAGVLFLDELNRAPMLVQNACFQLVLDRRIGEYVLPEGWTVLAAGNRESDGGGITRMSSALSNRFEHLEAETDLDDWCLWAAAVGIEPAVVAFLRFRPELLHKFDRDARAFPTPRSWEFVSRIIAQQPPPRVEHALFGGAVGTGAAVEFSAFLRLYRDLPDMDAILANPTSSFVPGAPAALYAVAAALARKATITNFGSVIKYLNRLPQEYAVMAVKGATGRDPALSHCEAFARWAVAHKDVLL